MDSPDHKEQDASQSTCQADKPASVTAALGNLAPRSRVLNALQLLVDTHVMVTVTDADGCIIYANDRFCDLSQYSRDELVGNTHRMVRSGAQADIFFAEIWKTVSSGETWSGEITNVAKDGTPFDVCATISPILDEKGGIAGYTSIETEITASRQLPSSPSNDEDPVNSKLVEALNVLDTAITVVDEDGNILVANTAHEKMYPDRAETKKPGKHLNEALRAAKPARPEEEIARVYDMLFTTEAVELRQLDDGRKIQYQRALLASGGFVSLHTDISQPLENIEELKIQSAAMDLMRVIAVDANESPDTDTAYAACLKRICGFTGWEIGHVYLADEKSRRAMPTGNWACLDDGDWPCREQDTFAPFREKTKNQFFERGCGLPGRVIETGRPYWIENVTVDQNFPRAEAARQSGLIGGSAFPVKLRGEVVAVLEFYSTRPIKHSKRLEEIVAHLCAQMDRVAEREDAERRLMDRVKAEIERRDSQLVEQNERFNAALAHMTQGLCMFDKDQKLIVANHRYAQMYGLSTDILKPGITLREIVQHRIDNGIYSGDSPDDYIKERMKWVSQRGRHSKTQTLNDGRVLAITYEPMDGGGWLTTHEDITKRVISEKTLQETQELVSKAFRASPAAIAISNPKDGAHLDVNEAWCAMLGYTREDALARSATELGLWAKPEMRSAFVDEIEKSGSIKGLETVFRRKDGNVIDVVISGEQLEIGGRQRLLVASYDITERKKAETALRDSQERFRSLVESTNVAPWEFNPNEMRFTYVGPQVVDMFGYPAEDWLEPDFWQSIIHPDDRDSALATCTEATQACMDHDFEYRIISAEGQERWVRDVVSVISENGQPKSLRGILIDVSERVKARQALELSEQRFKNIVEISSDWVWECDEDLRFTYVSGRFAEAAGAPAESIIGKTRHELGTDSGADWDAHLADLTARRPFRNFCYAVETVHGTRHWSVSGRPVFDANGAFKGYHGTGHDQTDAVNAEEELIRHRDHLQDLVTEATSQLKERADDLKQALAKEKEVNELQRQFLSMASHEFRTPLAIIDSAAQRLLRRGEKPDEGKMDRRIDNIRSAVSRMTQLMESTLAAARFEDGQGTLKVDSFDFTSLIRQVCDDQKEIAPSHTVVCDFEISPITITADRSALEQVFSNLLSNAVKYSPENEKIEVYVTVEDQTLVVSVKDYGVGIDADELPKMFQRFFRARTSSGIAGTGIGLNLVKTLIELHEGVISVESAPGSGSTFTVRLPLGGPKAAHVDEGQAA